MDTYSTNTLIGVVQGLFMPPSGLLDRYFRRTTQDEAEEIHFDRIDEKRRIAPFVSPLVEGQIVEGLGYKTSTFTPAYVKDKRVFDPSKPLKRAIGEQIGGGQLSNQQRRDLYVAQELEDQTKMLNRRLELMASEVIRTAKVTVTGDKYPTVVVDFGRDAALTPAPLAGGALWSAGTSKPRKDLKTWQKLVRQKSGSNPVDVVMGDDALDAFLEHASVSATLDNRNTVGQQMAPGTEVVEGLTFHGVIDRLNIFSYSGWYVDPADNTEKAMWPADVVALASSAIEGVRAFGAIRDGKAGFRAVPFFPKMWEAEDPAIEYLMLQSAPLIVPLRPNATLAVDVL